MATKIGLALGGGAGLGWAHIGVIKCLIAHGIKPHAIAGTSIGAIVGACVAAGKLSEVESVARNMTLRELVSLGQFGFGSGGIVGTDKIEKEIRSYLGTQTIETLPIQFSAIAADILTGERIELTEGDVVEAALASSAIPGIFPPRTYQGHMLVDGGVVDPMPCQSLIERGCDYIIGIDLQGDYSGRIDRLGLANSKDKIRGRAMKMARASMFLLMKQIGQERLKSYPADLVITPKVGHYEMADFTNADELIQLGYQETESQIFSLSQSLEKL